MNHLEVIEDALSALEICLYSHGPACVCTSCTASRQATALLPRLAHVLSILAAWSDDAEGEPYLAQDLGMLLTLLEEGSTTCLTAATPREKTR
jgi:hypothetical protein